MPQIRCPNCGLTINLKRRKKIDFNLITGATEKKPRTFTELLHITKLPRKTLSLRLKELCTNGALVRKQHMYKLNGASSFGGETRDSAERFSRLFHNRKVRTGLMLVMLLAFSSASGYVLARFFELPSPVETVEGSVVVGTFVMALDIDGVEDLYDWQVAVSYGSGELEVVELVPGGFVGEGFPFFVTSTDSYEGLLLLGGSLKGEVSGKSGSGRLATIAFAYFAENYHEPEIVVEKVFKTFLTDSQNQPIAIDDSTLTLTVIG